MRHGHIKGKTAGNWQSSMEAARAAEQVATSTPDASPEELALWSGTITATNTLAGLLTGNGTYEIHLNTSWENQDKMVSITIRKT